MEIFTTDFCKIHFNKMTNNFLLNFNFSVQKSLTENESPDQDFYSKINHVFKKIGQTHCIFHLKCVKIPRH